MASSVAREIKNVFPPKKRQLDKASGESKSSGNCLQLKGFDWDDDECVRQYISFYYQFHGSEGFVIDWDKLDYRFDVSPIIDPFSADDRQNNDETLRDAACRAICQYNSDAGTRLVFVDHVSASYRRCGGMMYWITFWARDLSSSSPQPKLYQTKCRRCGSLFMIYIFRLKPSDDEIAAFEVDPPPPVDITFPDVPTILFTVTGPGSGSIPEVAFTRIPPEVEDSLSSSESGS